MTPWLCFYMPSLYDVNVLLESPCAFLEFWICVIVPALTNLLRPTKWYPVMRTRVDLLAYFSPFVVRELRNQLS